MFSQEVQVWFYRVAIWMLIKIDMLLVSLGIRLCPISVANVLKGLPAEVAQGASDPDLAEPFKLLMKDMEQSQWPNLVDRWIFKVEWQSHLRIRADVKEIISRYPSVCNVAIKRPIFLIGLPRSGTTIAQRLLSCDDRFFTPMFWEVLFPCPPIQNGLLTEPLGRNENWTQSARYMQCEKMIGFFTLQYLDGRKGHLYRPDLPEDCFHILARSVLDYTRIIHVPDARRWTEWVQDVPVENMERVYRFFKQQVQVMAHTGLESRTYVSKASIHLVGLEGLMKVFPDARFVFSYRPLSQVVPSLSSVTRMMYGRTCLDAQFGRRMGRWVGALANRYAAVSARYDHLQQHPFYTYQYKDIMADPIGTMRGIYEHLGEELTPEVETRMCEFLARNPYHCLGKHDYSMEEYNLTEEMLLEESRPYVDYMVNKGIPITDII